jgi:hypothetical protein
MSSSGVPKAWKVFSAEAVGDQLFYMGVHSHHPPKNRWIVYFMENPSIKFYKWMIWGVPP